MQIVTSLLFVVVFLLGVFSLGQQSLHEVQPSSFLPSDTLIYLEQKNGTQAIQRFQKSRFGKALSSIDFVKVLQENEIDSEYLAIIEKTLASLEKLGDDRLVHEILGKRCTLALFAKRSWAADDGDYLEFLKDHVLLLSKPRINAETLDAIISSYTGDISVTNVPYGKYSIRRFQVKDDVISVVYADGFILSALEERVLREALDLHDRKVNTLKMYPEFQSLTKELEGSERMFYFSIDGLQALAQYGAEHASTSKEQLLLAELSSFKGVRTLAYGAWHTKKLLKNRVFVRVNHENMKLQVKEMIETSPSINGTLPFVTRDVLFYYWSNTLNIKLLWDMYVSESGISSQGIQDIQTSIRQISGHELNDITEMISGNVSILVQENARDQFVPIPDIALLLKVQDSTRITQVIEQSLENLDIKMQSRKYKDIDYYYLGLNPQESLQPVYAIHRDYLIFANSLDILKTIIDTPINNSRLVATKKFKELDPGFQTLNNSVCYIDQVRLLTHLQEFISWAGTMLAIQDRQAAEKSKIFIDNLINPLFFGIGMYGQSATRTYLNGDKIIIESQTRITQ